jgi:hypothetical protein
VALADCLAAQQDMAGAEPHYRAAHSGLAAVAAAAEPGGGDAAREAALAAAEAAHGLGVALVSQNKAGEAEPVLKEALEARRRLLGPVSASVVSSVGDMWFGRLSRERDTVVTTM